MNVSFICSFLLLRLYICGNALMFRANDISYLFVASLLFLPLVSMCDSFPEYVGQILRFRDCLLWLGHALCIYPWTFVPFVLHNLTGICLILIDIHQFVCMCLSFGVSILGGFFIVLVVLNDISMLEFLNKFVIILVSGPLRYIRKPYIIVTLCIQ